MDAANPPFELRIGEKRGNFNALLGALRQITVVSRGARLFVGVHRHQPLKLPTEGITQRIHL